MKRLYLVLLCLLLAIPLLAGFSQSLTGADSLRIGSRFTLNIDTDFPLRKIEIPDTLTSFRVLDSRITRKDEGSHAELDLMPLRTGALSFPKLKLKGTGILPSGGETDAFRVFVLRSRAEEDTLLREIKPLESYPWQIPLWLYFLLLATAFVSSLMVLISRLRARKPKPKPKPVPIVPKEPAAPEEPKVLPYKRALDELEELEHSGLLESDMLEYHFRLSLILREFIHGNYGVSALEMTTFEISMALSDSITENRREIMDFLIYADMVKFASARPELHEIVARTQELKLLFWRYAPVQDA